MFSELLEFDHVERFMEIGTGSGVIAVNAALAGVQSVVATDLSTCAVANARANALRHRVQRIVSVICCDLFEGINPREKFDLIFWNAPWVMLREGDETRDALWNCIGDVNYAKLRMFMSEGITRLAQSGRLLVGFGSFGNLERLDEIAFELSLRLSAVAKKRDRASGYEYSVLRVARATPSIGS